MHRPQATPPTIFGGFALLRAVLLRERIGLVHAHGAFSAVAHEAIIHARTMGYQVGCGHRPIPRSLLSSQKHLLSVLSHGPCNA